ncbi:hypothetical protein GCM10023323_23040 [Streptomyces thinghirensis]|uniref:Uncharacterized protein n=1 Tax=Streptomyces thinghirensis TaxID=551547 RepID=A0ABP9T3V3_9ACTN
MSAEKETAPLSHETQRSPVTDGFRAGLAVEATGWRRGARALLLVLRLELPVSSVGLGVSSLVRGSPQLVGEAAGELGYRVGTELTRYQVELRTDPHVRLKEADDQIRCTRTAAARAAARIGLRIASTGTPVLGQAAPVPITGGARYARSTAHFRALDDEQTACACHIHVGLPDPVLPCTSATTCGPGCRP